MKKNKKNLLIILTIFLYIIIFSLTNYYKEVSIQKITDKQLETLETQYEITKNYFEIEVYIQNEFINNDNKLIEILSKALNANENEKKLLRQELYDYLSPIYSQMRLKGVHQFQFQLANNITFLRMHKVDKFGDDLSKIRYSYKYTNNTKKPINGFEQGRSSHAIRYVFPLFDKKQNYLGAYEISLSSDFIQKKLFTVNKIYTHFLVDKMIFDTKTWETKYLTSQYKKSIENENYMFSENNDMNNELLIDKEKIVKPIKNLIDENIEKKESFSIYTKYKKNIVVINFLAIKNIKDNKTVAYLVSYENDENILNILFYYKVLIFILFIFIALVNFLIYRYVDYTEKLEFEVEEKTHILMEINETLDLRIKEKTKEQDTLLSLFNKGDSVLFKWNNDADWSVEYVSTSVNKLLGYDVDDFINNRILYASCIHEDDLLNVINEVKEGRLRNDLYFRHTPYRIITKDNKIKWVLDYTVILKNEKNEITHYLGYLSDITEQRNKDTLLYEQSKLASMGEMIGNIAHQWRQPLSVISTIATGSKIQKELDVLSNDVFIKNMNTINDNVQYLSQTIDDFRNFIKNERTIKIFKLKDTINHFLNLVHSTIISNRINLILEIENDIEIYGYENELIQCFINIFNNAKDALKAITEEDRYFFIKTKEVNNEIIIKFKDSANGIDDVILSKIFEPYFTTKSNSAGTGLGLFMTQKLIIQGMHGSINVKNSLFTHDNKQLKGCEFIIKLSQLN